MSSRTIHTSNAKLPTKDPVNCADCRLASICLPISLKLNDIDQLDNIIQRGRPVHRGDKVYTAGDSFHSVYAIRSGAVKTITITTDGQELVTGFYLPGEVIGLDGLATNEHTNTALVLETSAICEIPFSRLEDLSAQVPSLQRRFFQLMSKEIRHDQYLISLLSKNTADERVASLLLSISARHQQRGLSAKEFYLPMSRQDIGNYLGLTIETVSRVLTRFNKLEIISLNKKHVIINDHQALVDIASGANNQN